MTSHDVYFQGKLLHINVSAGIIVSNQSLVLQGVSRSTAGNYTCVGYNAEGEGESEPFYLNILCKYQSKSLFLTIVVKVFQENTNVSMLVSFSVIVREGNKSIFFTTL